MGWWKRLKLASPLAPVACPLCSNHMLVDVNEPIGSNASQAYAVQGSGQCFTRCPSCNKFLRISWGGEFMNFTKPSIVAPADNQEVFDRTRLGPGNPKPMAIMKSSPASHEEFQEFNEILHMAPAV